MINKLLVEDCRERKKEALQNEKLGYFVMVGVPYVPSIDN